MKILLGYNPKVCQGVYTFYILYSVINNIYDQSKLADK